MLETTIKTRHGKRRRVEGYACHLDGRPYSGATCDTKPAARADLDRVLLAALDRLATGTSIQRWQGRAIIIHPTAWGWAYTFDDLSSGCVQDGGATFEQAEDRAYSHCAQCVWSLASHPRETDDRALVASLPDRQRAALGADLLAYFAWQRGYAAAKWQGRGDADCRVTADEYQRREQDRQRAER